MQQTTDPEIAALKIILSNVVARLALATTGDGDQVRAMLSGMTDECKLAAEHMTVNSAGGDRARIVNEMLREIDEFFKGITIT